MRQTVTCPNGHMLQMKDDYAGKTLCCPQCQELVTPAQGQAGGAVPGTARTGRRGKFFSLGAGAALLALTAAAYLGLRPPARDPAKDRAEAEDVARAYLEF